MALREDQDLSTNGSRLLVIERILRDRQGIWQQIVEDRDLTRLTGQMLISSMIAPLKSMTSTVPQPPLESGTGSGDAGAMGR